jgi:hypothetical protein
MLDDNGPAEKMSDEKNNHDFGFDFLRFTTTLTCAVMASAKGSAVSTTVPLGTALVVALRSCPRLADDVAFNMDCIFEDSLEND